MNKPLGRECGVDGCTRPVLRDGGLDMCGMHYQRTRKHGSPDACQEGWVRCRLLGPDNPNWSGDDASYAAVHLRLARQRGPALGHACVDCPRTARHWSYDGTDPDERRDSMGRYSTDLRRYVPRCARCHSAHDRAQRARQEEQAS